MQHASHTLRALGQSPQPEHLRYGIAHHPVAWVLCASAGEDVRAVVLGDSPECLVQEVQQRFFHARIERAQSALQKALATVLGLLDGGPPLSLPPPLCGTPFQKEVWQALIKIPLGATTTYGAIAASIGRPNAARAVGAACGQNPLAIIVPCHRVLHGGGPKMGYRWGVVLKQRLLAHEERLVGAKIAQEDNTPPC